MPLRPYKAPLQVMLIIALSIFVGEFLVMIALLFMPHESPLVHALVDSAILVSLLSPILYFFIFRPLLMQIRERLKVEVNLRKERDRAQGYLDVAGVILVVIDTTGRVSLINKKGCSILGCQEEDIVGRNWVENFVAEDFRDEVSGALTVPGSSYLNGESYVEYPVLTRGGEQRVILWHNSLLKESGRVIGVLSSGEDITERKRAEQALKESETRYRLVHNSAFDGIILSDSSDLVKDCNPSAEKIFGYGPGKLTGTSLLKLMPEKYRKGHVDGLTRFLKTGRSTIQDRVLELEGLRKDGEVFPIELVLGSFSHAGEVFFTGTIRDITARKLAEQEKELFQRHLNQVQKMEAVGTLAGGVAHDFNNMLTAIRGNAELAMEDVDRDSPLFERIEEIILSVTHASKLTRQLLLFSRGQPFKLVPLDINRVIEDVMIIINRLMSEDVRVVTELDPDAWTVEADESNLEQVVMNLAVNARDAMPGGGTLTIKTENLVCNEAECRNMPEAVPGAVVRLSVSDTGAGMTEEVQHRIFEPFFSTKETGKGTGLGLAVVYGIVKQHGGWIGLESKPGAGTTFTIYLPAKPSQQADMIVETSKETGRPRGNGERILLVEEDARVLELTARALAESGFDVVPASGANEAAEVFEREEKRFDLVFCDIPSTEQSAAGFIDKVRAEAPETAVLVTGNPVDTGQKGWAGEKEGVELLNKPYSLFDLLKAVARVLQKKKT